MTDSERQQILKMIEDGKISAEQGLVLMQALADDEPEDELVVPELPGAETTPPAVEVLPPAGMLQSEPRSDPEFDRKLNRFRSLWTIPLWLGVALTVSGAYWMYTALQTAGFGFGFFFAWLPFLLGVLLTALAFSSRNSRWIYINVRQRPGESPQQIVLAFPLSLVSWILQFTKHSISDGERGASSEVMNAIFESTHSNGPLMVDVQEEDGEHVQVYIG